MQINRTNNKKDCPNLLIYMLLIALLLLLLAAFWIFILINPSFFSQSAGNANRTTSISKQLDENGSAIDGTLKSKSQDEILKELQEKQITVTDKLASHIFFSSGKSGAEGNWVVENVASNTVAIQCEVFLGDKLIAKSVPIRPNQHIKTIILSEDVEPGEYDVIAYVNYFTLDSGEYLAKAGFKIKMTVQ